MSGTSISDSHNQQCKAQSVTVPIEDMVFMLQRQRDVLIQQLRTVDELLLRYGALSHETLPRRVR